MRPLIIVLALKVVTFIAATAQTVGFVGLFFFEALDPYKWHLLIGGTIAIICSEGLGYWYAKRLAQDDTDE